MAVVTISRQLGSAGDYIANLVASMLAYKLVNKHSIIMEAHRRGLIDTDHVDEIGEGKPSILDRLHERKSRAIYAIRTVMRELASQGSVVIVGRGGQAELTDYSNVFNVRIIADTETRIARVASEKGISKEQAKKMIRQVDKERTGYVKHFFLVDSSDPALYDLIINTTRVSPDLAASIIVQAARKFRGIRSESVGV